MALTEQDPKPHHTLLSLNVTGGFLAGLKLEFADGLNCLIGGRGTGKTTALEFLRFGLGLMPDPRNHPQRHRSVDGLVKANLSGGRLSIELHTKAGIRYTARRGVSDEVQVLNESGAPVPVTLDRELIFTADIFSQNEIEEIASDPAAQLALLDRFIPEASAVGTELESLHLQLSQLTVDLRRVDREVEDFRATASELPMLEEKLKALMQGAGPDAEKVTHAHGAKAARQREAQLTEQMRLAVERAADDVNASAAAFRAALDVQLDATVRSGPNKDLIVALDADLHAFAGSFDEAAKTVAIARDTTKQRLNMHRAAIAERHAKQDDEYARLLAMLEEEGDRAVERASIQQRRSTALVAQQQIDAKGKQGETIRRRRRELLQRISELRDKRFAARKRVAENLTQRFPSIRVRVVQAGDLQAYRDLIVEALRGARMKHGVAADRLAEVFLPDELARAIVGCDYQLVGKRTGYDQERVKKILDTLREEGAAYTIEAVELHDVPSIELLDGTQYKASPSLSTGQRCTTILPILLVQSERPLLVDQPEDNLDNAFIYETVVKALQSVKGARQVIFRSDPRSRGFGGVIAGGA